MKVSEQKGTYHTYRTLGLIGKIARYAHMYFQQMGLGGGRLVAPRGHKGRPKAGYRVRGTPWGGFHKRKHLNRRTHFLGRRKGGVTPGKIGGKRKPKRRKKKNGGGHEIALMGDPRSPTWAHKGSKKREEEEKIVVKNTLRWGKKN